MLLGLPIESAEILYIFCMFLNTSQVLILPDNIQFYKWKRTK